MKRKDKQFILTVISFILFILVFWLMSKYNKTHTYYIADMDMYLSISKTRDGCYIAFEKGKKTRKSIKKKDYILIPNKGSATILYDANNKDNLFIRPLPPDFKLEDPVLDYQEINYNMIIYQDKDLELYISRHYDKINKTFIEPYNVIEVDASYKWVYLNGTAVIEGLKFGKPD